MMCTCTQLRHHGHASAHHHVHTLPPAWTCDAAGGGGSGWYNWQTGALTEGGLIIEPSIGSGVPEPSVLILIGLGLIAVMVLGWFKRVGG